MCAGQPGDHRGAGAAFALPQQALGAGQVDEPGVPRVDPHPPPGLRRSAPSGAFPRRVSSMPSTRVGCGLAQQLPRRGRRTRGARSATTRRVRRRPRPPSGPPPRSPRRSGCAAAQVVRARAGTCAMASVKDAAFAVVLPASPAGFVPPHHDTVLAVRDVARRGDHPALHRRRRPPHTTGTPPPLARRSPRAPHGSRRPGAQHARPVLLAARTTMSYRQARPLAPSSVWMLRNFQTSEGQGPPHAATRPMRAKSQLPV